MQIVLSRVILSNGLSYSNQAIHEIEQTFIESA